VSISCGIIGSFIVFKRLVFLSSGIAHSSFGGVGLGYLLGINPLLMALPFSLGVGGLLAFLSRRFHLDEDSGIGVIWTFGMALGVLFMSFTGENTPGLPETLFGSIQSITALDIILMAVLNLIILVLVGLFFKEFVAISYDEEFAQSRGLPVTTLYTTLILLIALSVVVLVQSVGILMIIALLSIPVLTAKRFTVSLLGIMALSILFTFLANIIGIFLALSADLPSGAMIVLTAIALYLLSWGVTVFRSP
jgi:zinc transport system permease protein